MIFFATIGIGLSLVSPPADLDPPAPAVELVELAPPVVGEPWRLDIRGATAASVGLISVGTPGQLAAGEPAWTGIWTGEGPVAVPLPDQRGLARVRLAASAVLVSGGAAGVTQTGTLDVAIALPAESDNLLTNGGAETGSFSGWMLQAGFWEIVTDPVQSGSFAFQTSSNYRRTHSLIDLQALGFDLDVFQHGPPIVFRTFVQADSVSAPSDAHFVVLRARNSSMQVLGNSGNSTQGLPMELGNWETLDVTLKDYAPGIRFIEVEEFGSFPQVRLDQASVRVFPTARTPRTP